MLVQHLKAGAPRLEITWEKSLYINIIKKRLDINIISHNGGNSMGKSSTLGKNSEFSV